MQSPVSSITTITRNLLNYYNPRSPKVSRLVELKFGALNCNRLELTNYQLTKLHSSNLSADLMTENELAAVVGLRPRHVGGVEQPSPLKPSDLG
jgi:hypothetical protein